MRNKQAPPLSEFIAMTRFCDLNFNVKRNTILRFELSVKRNTS